MSGAQARAGGVAGPSGHSLGAPGAPQLLSRGDTVAGLDRLISLPRLNSFGGGSRGSWGAGLAAGGPLDPLWGQPGGPMPFEGPDPPGLGLDLGLGALEAQISPDVDAEVPMIDLTVMGDRKPSMALLDHRGAGVFRAPSERSLRDLVLAPGAFQGQQHLLLQQQQPVQLGGAHLGGPPPLPLAGLMPPPAPYQSKLQQRASKRARRSRGSHLGPGAGGIAWSSGPLLSAPAPSEVAPLPGAAAVPRPSPCGTRTLGPGPSADGAACPHASPQEMHGPKGIPHGEADYTDAVRLLKPNEDVFWALMRNCEGLRAGARGDLQGSFQILHFDSENSPVFVDEVLKRIKRLDSNGMERKFKRVERLSDNQELCLASLRPQLFVPTNVEKQTFKLVRPQGRVCCEKRNEGIHRRVLGNYYYTGFCANHVSGEGPGTSLAAWKASNGRTILGFNVMTPRAQDNKATRQRHFLCLETFAGKVFLKWCTQCHTWKNLELYMPEEGPTEVRTFCQVCHERQIASRMSRKNIPKKKRKR